MSTEEKTSVSPPAEENAERLPGAGEKLRAALEQRGVSLEEAAEATRISKRYLEALEQDSPMERQPITREGYDKLREEIRRLEQEEMPAIAEKIAAARAEGDLSENAEYHGQREAQGLLQAKINQLKSKLANCYIADKSQMPKGVVTFGSRVTVKDLSDDTLEKYEMVGPGEEDYDGEVMKILTSSPIAQSLLGKKVGEQVEVEIPAGTLRMEVVEIEDH
jgi:transcription elongation factor GreA